MHESHTPSCDHCSKFAYPFSGDSPLADWGFCLAVCDGVMPGEALLAELETAASEGDYGKICGTKGLFQDSDDACDRYEPR